jgi:ribonuclease HI
MNRVHMFTDGACRGNPGVGGWGVLLRYKGRERTLNGAEENTTNNRMELTATIKGLEALTKVSEVVITTDSKYVKDGINTWIHNWIKNNWRTSDKKPVKNVELWKELLALTQKHQVQWEWVKGHSGHPENDLVDQLANDAIDIYLMTREK